MNKQGILEGLLFVVGDDGLTLKQISELLDEDIYDRIRKIKGSEWTEKFADEVYCNVKKHKYFITNLGECTQVDARALPDSVYKEYLSLLEKEIEIINPKVVILFGNQVSSIVLNENIKAISFISATDIRKKSLFAFIFNVR